MKVKNVAYLAGSIFLIVSIMLTNTTFAGWGIKDLDPFNKNSGIRRSAREFDQQRLDAVAYNFYLHNKCPEYLDVTFKYIPRGSSSWKTNQYSFKPGEHARLDASRNRYVYVSARSTSSYSNKRWKKKKIDMGKTYTKYTHSLTCT